MVATTSQLYRSVHTQPDAIRALLDDWDGTRRAAEQLSQARRILLAGIGTSYHAALVGEYILRFAGADAWAQRSFEFVNYPRPLYEKDAFILISHRGSKMYGIQAGQLAARAAAFTVGISGKNSQMQGVDILLETVEQELSSTHSISYTTALTRLAQIGTSLAQLLGNEAQARALEDGLRRLPALMDNILAHEDDIRQLALPAEQEERRYYFIGAGPNAPTATEGALKAKEASYVTAEGFELEQAIHGPLVAFEARDQLIILNTAGPAQNRVISLLEALNEIGSNVALLGDMPAEASSLFQRPNWRHIPLITTVADLPLPEVLTPLLAALPVQLLADFLASARRTNADSFRKDQEIYEKACSHIRL